VRRFIEANRASGRLDSAAAREWEELLAKMRPVVEKMVHGQLQGRWRQDREDVVQNTLLKLCNPDKAALWLASPKQTWFCHWVRAVAFNCAMDCFRKGKRLGEGIAVDDSPDRSNRGPAREKEQEEEAERLRNSINTTLSEFAPDWQLCFFMRFSYFDPRISDIADAAGIAAETVFFRLNKIKKGILNKHKAPIPPDLSRVILVGTMHPVDGFCSLEPLRQNRINDRINQLLRFRSLKEKFVFYARYSPLVLDVDALTVRLSERKETVVAWLEQMGIEIGLQCGPSVR
jgi:RNA polymerase sigma factor (sigma-70 family)